jgi:hypothetical protein
MRRPRLRDNRGKGPFELYPLGQIPDEVIGNIGKWMACLFSTGRNDIGGGDWGDVFAKSIGGEHLGKPLGLADVVHGEMAWSVKSVKSGNPHKESRVRLISGRNSPAYSNDMENPYEDVQETGNAVISIWTERVNVAKSKYEPLRTSVLIRNFNRLEFTLFEHETTRFDPKDYVWSENKRGNFEGHAIKDGRHVFTWQPSGSHFTILSDVPLSARKFKVKRPPMLDLEKLMSSFSFDESWVTIL